jgi:tRNA1(Val) A37 N6-methylase TrmN6
MELDAPHFLRVKEIFEAVETFLLVQKFVVAQGAQCRSIFDLGCGNGLLGE